MKAQIQLVEPAKRYIGVAATWGVILTFAAVFVAFSVDMPSVFFTGANMASILNSAVVDALFAAGLTVPLIMNDFDLSIGSMASLGSALAVVLISERGWASGTAILLVLFVAACVGLINGVLIAVLNASSFIITLAMGSVLTGIEFLLTKQQTIVGGIPTSYTNIGSDSVGGVTLPVFVTAAIVALGGLSLGHSVMGREVYAVGSNREAARLAGVRVLALRLTGLALSAVLAALAGIFITSVAGSSFPSAGASHLLPAFAAVFLGSALFPSRRFSIVGAAISAVLLEMVATGLVEMNLESWTINVFDGGVLILAILTALKTRMVAQ